MQLYSSFTSLLVLPCSFNSLDCDLLPGTQVLSFASMCGGSLPFLWTLSWPGLLFTLVRAGNQDTHTDMIIMYISHAGCLMVQEPFSSHTIQVNVMG